ncbi:hypothetical protein Y1Q_0000711 [Alligator mississippiensis]|uniref:Uncharacterized protein n=1 Tax=Alligator mississippiensis TaxID=8496 RepID=A0A151MC70_ALLMI|nr:hypothetical protein Y1Q_0000711 [Alligator mississippiensis]
MREAMREGKTWIGAWYRGQSRKKIFLAQAPWVEDGEEWSAYFRKIKETKKEAMTSPVDGAEVEHQSIEGILEMVVAFYQKLYAAQPGDPRAMQDCLQRLTQVLREDEGQKLVEEWMLEEVSTMLCSF